MALVSRPVFVTRLAYAILPVVFASLIGAYVTAPAIPLWYQGLDKPAFSPPNWVFGPVWTVLYIFMGYAVFRILSLPAETKGRTLALSLYFIQIALNAAWSPAFFGLQSPLAGLIVILPLTVLIYCTIQAFTDLDKLAAVLLVPYAFWSSFASILNIAIWKING